jgi:hypothetical protein
VLLVLENDWKGNEAVARVWRVAAMADTSTITPGSFQNRTAQRSRPMAVLTMVPDRGAPEHIAGAQALLRAGQGFREVLRLDRGSVYELLLPAVDGP